MEIKERIATCLSDLERKRQSVEVFQSRLRLLIDRLRTGGVKPGSLPDLLATLESVLQDYAEMGASCTAMVEGLREIGDHLTRIEDGRQKILSGVEAILQNLSHLDKITQAGVQVGSGGGSKAPKRILLVRIQPDAGEKRLREEDEDDEGPAGSSTVIH